MLATERRTAEREFHDRQAAGRAALRPELRFEDDDYLDHESWVRFAFERLGALRNKSVLDYGCGHGMAAVVLARAGANVTAFDLSPGYVNEAKQRAAANRVDVNGVVADGEELPFPDASFDAVWGNAILHHLDLAKAARELHRVLRPGGVAVFCEPWGGNPALAFTRRFLPYAGKDRTADERPLVKRDLAPLREVFPALRITGHQLFGMIPRMWRTRRSTRRHSPLDVLDHVALRAAPPLWNWCRYVVIELKKC
jgi:SAM-dependent methyltransferase